MCIFSNNQVADHKEIFQMARDAIKHIRLPLLSFDELSVLEEESKVDLFIPVSNNKIKKILYSER